MGRSQRKRTSRKSSAPTSDIQMGLDDIPSTFITISIDRTKLDPEQSNAISVRGQTRPDENYDLHHLKTKGPEVFMMDSSWSKKIDSLHSTLTSKLYETRNERQEKFRSFRSAERTERWKSLVGKIATLDKVNDYDYPIRIIDSTQREELGVKGYYEFSAFLSTKYNRSATASTDTSGGSSGDGSRDEQQSKYKTEYREPRAEMQKEEQRGRPRNRAPT
ncbi:hypothetical protein L486_06927 [Kwoniella mangroviensis CBS 10435]|uniref:Uncharacterized protein n=1 Tax=Kwoniella mangroviensis CBS 10435 TaxID=1331196 RepID=A0A1B9IJ94_9TREE|nr:hypothetical protein L486_06927 [Kwoniella mangroviensis CBS 10435]